jgi:hypothetical protein
MEREFGGHKESEEGRTQGECCSKSESLQHETKIEEDREVHARATFTYDDEAREDLQLFMELEELEEKSGKA